MSLHFGNFSNFDCSSTHRDCSSAKDESWSIMKGFEKNEWKQVKYKQLTTLEEVHYNGRLVKGFEKNEGKQVKLQQLRTLEEAHYNRHDSQTSAFSEI